MISIPKRIEELLLLPEFEMPLCFLNSHLFLSRELAERSVKSCEKGSTLFDIMYEEIGKTLYNKRMPPSDEKNYREAKDELYSRRRDTDLYKDYIRRLNTYSKAIKKNNLNPVRSVELLNDLGQRACAIGILSKSRDDKSNLVPILLYYGFLTATIMDMDTSDPSMIEENFGIIDAWRFRFLLVDDDEIKEDDEKTVEGKKKIIEHLKRKVAKNILAYARLLEELSPHMSQKTISGDFIFDRLGSIESAGPSIEADIDEVTVKRHREKNHIEFSVDEVLNGVYNSQVIGRIDDKYILEYKEFYEAKKLYKHLNRGRMSSIDILRLKKLEILEDREVKNLFEQYIRNNKNSKDSDKFELSVMWLYLGGFGREERKEELNLEYLIYRWSLEQEVISKDRIIYAISKGLVDANSIMRLVNEGFLPRNEVNETLESSENNIFKNLSYSKYEELLKRDDFDGQSFLAAIRYGWIDKKIVIELIANNLIPHNDAIEALEHSPRRNYNEIHEYDIETQIITWCATCQSSLKWISVGDLENKIREIKKDDEESKVYSPSDDLIEKIVELIHGDYNQLSALLTSTAFDYHSMDKVIDKSNEKGYLSQEATDRLRKVVKKFRIDQLENHQNAVKYDERDYPDDGGGNGENPFENQVLRLIYDPVKRLKIFAAINTNTKNPSIGNLKRIIIDGNHKNKDGEPVKSSFHGYELIILPEADVAILEKLYEVERIEEKSPDGTVSHRMQYKRDEQGHLIPVKDSNRTYILPLDEALELAQNFNKEQLHKSKKCKRCNHSLNWLENVGDSVKAVMKRDGKSNENTRNAEEKIDNVVNSYLEIMRRNYNELKDSQIQEQ